MKVKTLIINLNPNDNPWYRLYGLIGNAFWYDPLKNDEAGKKRLLNDPKHGRVGRGPSDYL
ncbi:MAG: hypothetical protein ACTSVA_00965 [Candidatus Njordarchaeales archaeon]